ncbi:MAG TPA: hypothetical protein VK911_03975 [Vicinamibacterales bacterium]|nr:hypothetical protein [Vicinamibacterales bacterium]
MSAGRILISVGIVFLATAAVHALLGSTPGERLLEVVAASVIAYVVFSVGLGRIRVAFLLLVTGVFVVLSAADLYWARTPFLSGRLSWVVVPAVVAALLLASRRRTLRAGGWRR